MSGPAVPVRERKVEQALKRMVEQHGGVCLKWVCPGWAGVPDRIILLPGGRVIFAEVKRPKGGRLSGRQLWWAHKLKALGFEYWTVWDDFDIFAIKQSIEERSGS